MQFLLSVILILFCNICIAAVGTITDQLEAPASIKRQTELIEGDKGVGIEMDDTVNTAQGKLGITFADDTTVQITDHSKLVVDDFVYDPKNKDANKLAVRVALGTVRYASGQIAKTKPQNVAVNTPSATISVRGTDFTATVDELGASTIILLPSCPDDVKNKISRDILTECKTGKIWVESDEGRVILDQPFQATKVDSRDSKPTPPVILNLSEDAISNLLILSPPKEFKKDKDNNKVDVKSGLDYEFLKTAVLANVLEEEQKQIYQSKLNRNYLQNDFLINLLDQIDAQLAASQQNVLAVHKNELLPDFLKNSGVIVSLDELAVELCREGGGDIQCVSVPRSQNTLIDQIQNGVEIKNRVNSGGNTFITLIQQ